MILGTNIFVQLGVNDNGEIPMRILNLRAKEISTGSEHTVMIDLDDNVWSFGNNYAGQLNLDKHNSRNKPTQILNIKAHQVSTGRRYTIITFGALVLMNVVNRVLVTIKI
jgi:alpha-tubulin suppressor-like RCC1 family protein